MTTTVTEIWVRHLCDLKLCEHDGKKAQGTSACCGIDSVQSVRPPYIDVHLFFAQFFPNMACRQHPPGLRNRLLSSLASDPEGRQRSDKGPVKPCSTDPLVQFVSQPFITIFVT